MMAAENNRIVVLDTETTGMNSEGGPTYLGHNIIEIGCVELVNRRPTGRHFHLYIKPERPIDPEAIDVHGITDEFLLDKPKFSHIAKEFYDFIEGAELVIHNAPFDIGFMDYEFSHLPGNPIGKTEEFCTITDSLVLARQMYPGQRNNLDTLCSRLGIDNSMRTLHGALLDAEILADVYLAMTREQKKLNLVTEGESANEEPGTIRRVTGFNLPVLRASEAELAAHEGRLDIVAKKGSCLWRN